MATETKDDEVKKFNLGPGEEKTVEELREDYEEVYSQVKNRTSLLTGYIKNDVEIAGLTFRLRTLRQREVAFLSQAALKEIFKENQVLYNLYVLTICLMAVEGADKTVPSPAADDSIEWLKDGAAKQKIDYLSDWDADLVTMVIGEQLKLETLKQIFLTEEVKKD